MTSIERVRKTQQVLGIISVVIAVSWAGAVVLGVLSIGTLLGAFAGLSAGLRAAVPWIAALGGITTLAAIAWRERFVWSFNKVALWIEERAPELRYALVTALDPRYADTAPALLEPVVSRVNTQPFVRRVAQQSMLPAMVAFIATALAFVAIPASWKAQAGTGNLFGQPKADNAPSRLDPLQGKITPPAYAIESGIEEQRLSNPTTLAGLEASKVEVTGRGEPDGIQATLGDSSLAVTADKDGWAVRFTMPDSAEALRLTDRQYRRLIVVAPRPDEAPVVQLVLPMRDTTIRVVTGSMSLDAILSDDIGIGAAKFEYIVSTGESEGDYKFREGALEHKQFKSAKKGRLTFSIPLSFFELKEGDQLQVRAVAVDNNNVTGPDSGFSETRMLRVARKGEYDSLAVEGAPPPSDTAMMTLRYLIQLTTELHAKRRRMPREKFVDASNKIGMDARRLIYKIEQLQSNWTMDGLFPPNQHLTIAHEELWEGTRSLYIAETGEALPHLWNALRAMQKFLFAKRYYIRGQLPEVPVNITRVRLQGTDTGYASVRTPRELAEAARRRLLKTYLDAVRQIRASPDSAVEALTLMQVEALREYPVIATALGEAVAAIRDKKDPGGHLQRVRLLLDGRPLVLDTIPRWTGAW